MVKVRNLHLSIMPCLAFTPSRPYHLNALGLDIMLKAVQDPEALLEDVFDLDPSEANELLDAWRPEENIRAALNTLARGTGELDPLHILALIKSPSDTFNDVLDGIWVNQRASAKRGQAARSLDFAKPIEPALKRTTSSSNLHLCLPQIHLQL